MNVCPNMTLISVPHSSLFIHSSVEPFPLESVPGYLDVVDKKLDLKTLSSNLEGGLYNSRQDFFEDASLIFTNAIKYHGARETKWIAKPAKEMLKVVQRELKNLDKRPSKILTKQKAGSLKLKMGMGMGGGTKIKKEGGKTPPPEAAGSGRDTPTMMPSADGDAAVKPKVTLKLKTGGGAKSKDKVVAAKAKPTQPKLKLKLSLSKKADAPPRPPSTSPVPGDEGAGAKPVTVKTEKTSKTTKIKLTGPRGKELPEGVTAPTTTKKTTGKSITVKAPATKAAAVKAPTKKTTKKTTTKKTKKVKFWPNLLPLRPKSRQKKSRPRRKKTINRT